MQRVTNKYLQNYPRYSPDHTSRALLFNQMNYSANIFLYYADKSVKSRDFPYFSATVSSNCYSLMHFISQLEIETGHFFFILNK